MRKLLVISSLFVVVFAQTAYATESTPSADIKAKLVEFQKEAASKAAQLKDLISKKLQNKAYIGRIKSKSDSSLTLATESDPKVISINEDTIQKVTFAEEDYIAALGDIDETGVLTARKIILLPPTDLPPKTYLWGQVISISDKLITLRDKAFKNSAVKLPDLPKVKINDYVILTGNLDRNNIFNAGFVYVMPQGAILKPKKLATPSAKSN